LYEGREVGKTLGFFESDVFTGKDVVGRFVGTANGLAVGLLVVGRTVG